MMGRRAMKHGPQRGHRWVFVMHALSRPRLTSENRPQGKGKLGGCSQVPALGHTWWQGRDSEGGGADGGRGFAEP